MDLTDNNYRPISGLKWKDNDVMATRFAKYLIVNRHLTVTRNDEIVQASQLTDKNPLLSTDIMKFDKGRRTIMYNEWSELARDEYILAGMVYMNPPKMILNKEYLGVLVNSNESEFGTRYSIDSGLGTSPSVYDLCGDMQFFDILGNDYMHMYVNLKDLTKRYTKDLIVKILSQSTKTRFIVSDKGKFRVVIDHGSFFAIIKNELRKITNVVKALFGNNIGNLYVPRSLFHGTPSENITMKSLQSGIRSKYMPYRIESEVDRIILADACTGHIIKDQLLNHSGSVSDVEYDQKKSTNKSTLSISYKSCKSESSDSTIGLDTLAVYNDCKDSDTVYMTGHSLAKELEMINTKHNQYRPIYRVGKSILVKSTIVLKFPIDQLHKQIIINHKSGVLDFTIADIIKKIPVIDTALQKKQTVDAILQKKKIIDDGMQKKQLIDTMKLLRFRQTISLNGVQQSMRDMTLDEYLDRPKLASHLVEEFEVIIGFEDLFF